MRLDIVTNDAGELVRREHARDLGANVVVALYRLARLAQLHDRNNQAFVRQLEQTHATIAEYGLRAGTHVSVLFAQKAVFVSGQLLKGSREKYEAANELGQIFEWCGGSELTIARDVTQAELLAFIEAVGAALRAEKGRGLRSPTPKIRLRPVNEAARHRGLDVEPLTYEQRLVRSYASAVVILRRFFDDLAASRYVLPHRIKRVAQNLVDLSAGHTPAFLGVTEARNANHDDAGRAVNSAILAVAIAREITDDNVTLAQIAMAAMMHDAGRPRAFALAAGATGSRLSAIAAQLTEQAEDRMPAGTAAVLTALGRVNEPSIRRTVIAFEALWLRRRASLGAAYHGVRAPTLHARIVTLARRYNDLLTPEPGLPPPSIEHALATLAAELTEPSDRTVLRMLASALGLVPVGTVVQLASGEIGEVIVAGAPGRAARVRVAMDAQGAVLAAPIEIDLGRAGDARQIARVMSVDGWKKGLDVKRAGASPQPPPRAADSNAPSRSAVVPTEPRMKSAAPVLTPVPPAPAAAPPRPEPRLAAPPPAPDVVSPAAVAATMGRMIEEALQTAPTDASPSGATPTTGAAPAIAASVAESARDADEPSPAARTDPPHAPHAGPERSATEPVGAAMAAAAIAPTARGTLGATPLVHVLVYMLDHALTGTVVFAAPDGLEHAIHFALGAATKVRIARATARIGEVLVASGVLKRDLLPEAIEGAKRLGLLVGEYLVGHDLVTRDQLARALEAQVGLKVASIVNLPPETTYSFYRDVDLLASIEPDAAVSDPLNVILATVRAWDDRARVRATLARIQKHPLVIHAQADPLGLALSPDERRVLEALRDDACTLTQLHERRLADEEVTSSLVYTLAVTRQFAFRGQKKPPMGGRGAPIPISVAPPAPSGERAPPTERVSVPALADLAPPSAPPSRASMVGDEANDERAPRAWRPPAAIPPGTMSERPRPMLERTSSEVAAADGALEAMTHFRQAEAALQRGDVAEAERHAARAAKLDAGEADYVALHTWVKAMSAQGDVALLDAIATLGKLIEKEPTERALLYRGKLLKRIKRLREALRDFERVLEMNPRHREAASEVRLIRQSRSR